jgi:hypothetical protein
MLLIFVADDKSPRLLYILNEILFKRLQITYTVTNNYDYFMRSHMPKINYSSSYIPNCVNIPAHTLLYQENIRKIEIEVTPNEKFQFTFFNIPFDFSKLVETPKQQIPFDIFSASFYLLSRYEEYIATKFDIHSRFKAEESLAYKHHFLQMPLVDIWAIALGNIIQKQYPEINYTLSQYHEIHSFDIDFAYKYKGLSSIRFYKKALGNMLRFNFTKLIKMFDKSLADEYDTYDFIFEELEKQKAASKFFFLVAEKIGQHDKNLLPTNTVYQQLIKHISSKFPIGVHPSYHASAIKSMLQNETNVLSKISNQPIENSRFHFLKFKLPNSYHYLIESNILNDYSMAYANKIGFRASTCKVFNFYNLAENKATSLQVFSPCVMDVTLKNFEKFKPNEAILAIEKMKQAVKNVNGTFISIWHNSNLSNTAEWKDWKAVWLKMIAR